MVGHTHSDIDQFFSMVSKRIFSKNVKTVKKLKGEIQASTKAYNVHVAVVDTVMDFKQASEKHTSHLQAVTTAHIFRFSSKDDGSVMFATKEWAESPTWSEVGELFTAHELSDIPCVQRDLLALNDFMKKIERLSEVFSMTEEQFRSWETFAQERREMESSPSWKIDSFKSLEGPHA